ncbi:MAG TPA: DUF3562 domain-containing protein [Acidimicrobiales bacterium]|nr:DUF3562 domain-containing protein [Acidimicrobiales bacterium]
MQRITRLLMSEVGGDAPDEVIERTVRDCFAERQDARIRDFVGLLAERSARERLRSVAAGGVSGRSAG